MIYLTEPKNLTAGLWWAREIIGEPHHSKRGNWCLAQITGDSPFLIGRAVMYRDIEGNWLAAHPDLLVIRNPGKFEFGPRIDIPSDKDRVEYAPQEPSV